MHVLVTGAAGFIGRHLVTTLAGRGDTVVAVDRRPVPPEVRARARVLAVDVSVPDPRLALALSTADAVVHLAGRAGVRDRAAAARWRDNVRAGATVLALTPPEAHAVVVSSSSVYGGAVPDQQGRPVPSEERHPLLPRGEYAQSKAVLEARAADRARTGGRVAVLRPFTVVGAHQRPDMALARWIDAALDGRPLLIYGDPSRSRDVTAGGEVVRVLAAVLDRGFTGTLNVGTGRSRSLADLLQAVAAVTGRTLEVRAAPAHPADPAHTLASTRRLATVAPLPVTDLHACVEDVARTTRRRGHPVTLTA